jgi:hypothetical protein
MSTNNKALDTYIRSVAASHALGTNGLFVGRKSLPKLCSAFLPDLIKLSESQHTKQEFLERLGELLKSGFAAELDKRTSGDTLLPLILWNTHLEAFSAAKKAVKAKKGKSPAENEGSEAGETTTTADPTTAQESIPSPSFTPPPPSPPATAITFALQHAVLPPLQCLLEEACYSYIAKKFPHILLQKSWTLPQAAELNAYTREILAAQPCPFSDPTPLKNLNEIRHAAVHRIPLSEDKLYELVEVGGRAASMLGEWSALIKIQTLKTKVQKWSKEMTSAETERTKVRRKLELLKDRKRKIEAEITTLETLVEKTEKVDRKTMRRFKAEVEDHFAWSDEDKSDNEDGKPGRLVSRPRIFIVHPHSAN